MFFARKRKVRKYIYLMEAPGWGYQGAPYMGEIGCCLDNALSLAMGYQKVKFRVEKYAVWLPLLLTRS